MAIQTFDEYHDAHSEWSAQMHRLRDVLTDLAFEETIKWGMPTYCRQGKNVISIGAFKHHLALWFHDGANLADPDDVLVNAQPGKTKSMRHMRFGQGDKIPVTRVRRYAKAALAHAKTA